MGSRGSRQAVPPRVEQLSNPVRNKSLTRQEMEDEKFLQTLVRRQKEQMPKIIGDLSKNGRKTLHYAWWLFPTELPGASEPLLGGSKTRVTVDTASRLLASQETAKEWRKALELVCDLVEKSKQNPTRILPFIDHGRVRFFLKFWGNKYKGSPDWLKAVVRRLDAFTWT
mmetsp:Transcript_10107/g.15822  ORF Transcript_10107/g.15822 Transcript_10107/m.15822 type:complete len:169 (+) Transcript_10107:480-986(+)|eukprot:CAMPEP_0184297298 /NCGR_PEP_ID=MMETSP1049-20130417/8226_1 /TAXON_ID=77928 /ORGANISM="Proteomonas sulcata, Strain CCMP704" /LENGTH=168 /DNA_ID=CAMNT_0026606963 /DNA_START=482 /DNA_END=988 /DNA_ORIENTATION=+